MLKIFGFRLLKPSEDAALTETAQRLLDLRARLTGAETQNELIAHEVKRLREEKKSMPMVNVTIGDPAPEDIEKRREYVAKVAGLHKDILEPKLGQMIARARAEMDSIENTDNYDLAMKGAIYSFKELLHWGEMLTGEQVANQIESSDDEEEEKTNN